MRKSSEKCLINVWHLKREDIVIKKSKLGYCAYSLYKASDTRDETLGIFGHHVPTKPYQALMGPYLINYYTSLSAARTFCKQHDLPVEDLNNGQEKEKIGEIVVYRFLVGKAPIPGYDLETRPQCMESWKAGTPVIVEI